MPMDMFGFPMAGQGGMVLLGSRMGNLALAGAAVNQLVMEVTLPGATLWPGLAGGEQVPYAMNPLALGWALSPALLSPLYSIIVEIAVQSISQGTGVTNLAVALFNDVSATIVSGGVGGLSRTIINGTGAKQVVLTSTGVGSGAPVVLNLVHDLTESQPLGIVSNVAADGALTLNSIHIWLVRHAQADVPYAFQPYGV